MECANVRSAGPRGKLTAGRPIRQGVHNVCFMFLRTPHSPLHRHPACAHLCSLTYEGGGGLGPGGGLPPPPAGLSRTIDHHTSNFLKNQSFTCISKINVNFNATRQSPFPGPVNSRPPCTVVKSFLVDRNFHYLPKFGDN